MKPDIQSKRGITNHQVEEAARLWDGGAGLTFVELGNLYGRSANTLRYHFIQRGIFTPKKRVKKVLDNKAA